VGEEEGRGFVKRGQRGEMKRSVIWLKQVGLGFDWESFWIQMRGYRGRKGKAISWRSSREGGVLLNSPKIRG